MCVIFGVYIVYMHDINYVPAWINIKSILVL